MFKWRRKPDLIIPRKCGEYLRRWHLLPRNPWLNVYLHHIVDSDDQEVLHDHPWHSLSLVLKGRYREKTPTGVCVREQGSVRFMPANHRHAIIVSRPCWTLFVTGPRFQAWGFWSGETFTPSRLHGVAREVRDETRSA